MPLDKNDIFEIEAWQLGQLAKLSLRLYSEKRMDGDQMRNAAQMLHALITRTACGAGFNPALQELATLAPATVDD